MNIGNEDKNDVEIEREMEARIKESIKKIRELNLIFAAEAPINTTNELFFSYTLILINFRIKIK